MPSRQPKRSEQAPTSRLSLAFHYSTAFSRNIGWVNPAEQEILRTKCVAIAGLGGVGGYHLLSLCRLGIGRFRIADPDSFELANFNRQVGATLSHVGKPKTETLARMALEINPEIQIEKFPSGIDDENLDAFLSRVDLYVDGLDFFALSARRAVFEACTARAIPAITAAPLGTGAALLNFLPGHMTFEEYFRLEGRSEEEQLVRFLVGLSPAMLQSRYLVFPQTVNLAAHRGPSTNMACEICASVASTQALKILLNRGKVVCAPRGLHFDPFLNKLAKTWRPGGNRHPLQRLAISVAKRHFVGVRTKPDSREPQPVHHAPTVERILELARWAPSGDNTQPWRFSIVGEDHIRVHGFDTRDHCVYDLQGHASQLALGALLETITIAASQFGLRAVAERWTEAPEESPVFDVRLTPDPATVPEPLLPFITMRSTQRRPMSLKPLDTSDLLTLEASVAPNYHVVWIQDLNARIRVARLLFANAKLRLTMPEAFEVHRSVIEWDSRFSETQIPSAAVGLDPLTLKLTKWAFGSWKRLDFLNRYLGGTLAPRLQLDLIPAIACAAHGVLVANETPNSIDDRIAAGRAVQRFWLTATSLGIWQQPEMTPLIFGSYVRNGVTFSQQAQHAKMANKIATQLKELLGAAASRNAVWMGRLGRGPAPVARSTRLPLQNLLLPDSP